MSLGHSKHRKAYGTVHNYNHFTGKQSDNGKRKRKGKGLTRKQRKAKRHTHINKYAICKE